MKANTERDSLLEWSQKIAQSAPRIVPVHQLPRRSVLALLGVVGGGLAFGLARRAEAQACPTGTRTPIEGPYYLGDPEERTDTGDGVIVRGRVLDEATCTPIPGAVIVRWHANDLGFYEEFYRAKMTVKQDGAYEMSTTAPGQYAGLARHIHWYVVAEGYAPVIAQTQWQEGEQIRGAVDWDFSLVKA